MAAATYTRLVVLALGGSALLELVLLATTAGGSELQWLCVLWPCLWAVGVLLWVVHVRRGAAVAARPNLQAVQLIGEGQPAEAARVLDDLLQTSRAWPWLYSIHLFNRGVAATRMGRFADARAMLGAVHAARWLEAPKYLPLLGGLLCERALLEALAGELPAAETWQRHAHQRLLSPAVSALTLDVVIATRRGKLDDAEALLQSKWAAAEATLPARDMKRLRVLRAFVSSLRAPDNRAAIDGWLAGVKPLPKEYLAYLATQWPEFAAFERVEL
jgi:hypothetical protein